MGCLYSIDFANGKRYIGVTKHNAEYRLRQHVRYHAKKLDTVLAKAIRKYGETSLTLRTLVVADDVEYLKALEIRAIAAFGTLRPGGYNSTAGGNGCIDPSGMSETIRVERMRATMATPEYLEKQSAALSASWDDEKRARRSAMVAALWKDPEYRARLVAAHKGKKHSAAQTEKLKISLAAAFQTPEFKLRKSASAKRAWETRRARASNAAAA